MGEGINQMTTSLKVQKTVDVVFARSLFSLSVSGSICQKRVPLQCKTNHQNVGLSQWNCDAGVPKQEHAFIQHFIS